MTASRPIEHNVIYGSTNSIGTDIDLTSDRRSRGVPGHFMNPVALGADPWIIWRDGWYYWCLSEDMKEVAVYRSRTLVEMGEKFIVWSPLSFGPYCAEIWAPELHFLDGKWFIYVAASDGDNRTHRMIVLEATGDLPTSQFQFKAEIYTGDHIHSGEHSRWAIDGTVLELNGRRYFLWSGWEAESDEQWLYIGEMSNPWTVCSNRVRICPNNDFLWEYVDETAGSRGLNEGPQILRRDGRVFVVFSASASWATTYKLGLLELSTNGDPMDPQMWRKYPEPVLQRTAETWGVGHCSFTQSPDGREDWIAFHAKLDTDANWNRAIHVQRFTWGACGTPKFGAPLPAGGLIQVPSGETPDSLLPEWKYDGGSDRSQRSLGYRTHSPLQDSDLSLRDAPLHHPPPGHRSAPATSG